MAWNSQLLNPDLPCQIPLCALCDSAVNLGLWHRLNSRNESRLCDHGVRHVLCCARNRLWRARERGCRLRKDDCAHEFFCSDLCARVRLHIRSQRSSAHREAERSQPTAWCETRSALHKGMKSRACARGGDRHLMDVPFRARATAVNSQEFFLARGCDRAQICARGESDQR